MLSNSSVSLGLMPLASKRRYRVPLGIFQNPMNYDDNTVIYWRSWNVAKLYSCLFNPKCLHAQVARVRTGAKAYCTICGRILCKTVMKRDQFMSAAKAYLEGKTQKGILFTEP